jgi:SAM-dependent methyltransferase
MNGFGVACMQSSLPGWVLMDDDESLIYKNAGNISLLDLLPSSPGTVLDCGCGAGDNARVLNERGWRVTGVTIDPREQKAARRFCAAVHLGDLEEGLPPGIVGTFDAVLASHVLEHLARPERLLHEVRQRLIPGGVLAVALPNIAHYRQRLLFLRGRFDYTDTGQLDRTHLRFYTHGTATRLLQENGYALVYAAVEGSLPWWKARRLVSSSTVDRVDNWAVERWPNLLGHQSLLLARPQQVCGS